VNVKNELASQEITIDGKHNDSQVNGNDDESVNQLIKAIHSLYICVSQFNKNICEDRQVL